MKLDITNQEKQPSFQRTIVHARIFAPGTSPSRQEVADALADELKAERSMVLVDQILPAYGDTSAKVTARVYTDAEVMARIERANLIEKNKKVEAEPEPEEEPEAQEPSSEDAQEQDDEDSEEEDSEKKSEE